MNKVHCYLQVNWYLIEPGEFVEGRKRAGRQPLPEIQQRIGVAVKEQFNGRFRDKQTALQHFHDAIEHHFEPERLVAQRVHRSLHDKVNIRQLYARLIERSCITTSGTFSVVTSSWSVPLLNASSKCHTRRCWKVTV